MLIITVITILLVLVVVGFHLKVLFTIAQLLPRLSISSQLKVILGIIGLIITHVIEIWIFAIVLFFLCQSGNFGFLQGDSQKGFTDYVYFSFVNYTTVGFGDYTPVGHIRFITGIESLAGILLITCSASFAFIMMHRFWEDQKMGQKKD